MAMERMPKKATTSDTATAAANTAVVITYTAVTGFQHCLGGVAWSYDAAPTGGNLKIEDGAGSTVFELDIAEAGPGAVVFDPPLMGSEGTACVVTLAAAGASVVGKLNCRHWRR